LAGFRPTARDASIAFEGPCARKSRAIAKNFSGRATRALIDVAARDVRASRGMLARASREKIAKIRGKMRVK
jgi:hypothetical protein